MFSPVVGANGMLIYGFPLESPSFISYPHKHFLIFNFDSYIDFFFPQDFLSQVAGDNVISCGVPFGVSFTFISHPYKHFHDIKFLNEINLYLSVMLTLLRGCNYAKFPYIVPFESFSFVASQKHFF